MPSPGRRNGSSYLLLLVQNTLMEVADDHAGQPLIVDEEALADRIRVLLRDLERCLEDLVGAETAVDEPLDRADPVFDNLPLFFEIGLGAGLAVAGDHCLDIERFDALQSRKPLPRVAFLQPAAASVKDVVAGE